MLAANIFFIGFLFWHSICEEMCHKILIKGGQKIYFLIQSIFSII